MTRCDPGGITGVTVLFWDIRHRSTCSHGQLDFEPPRPAYDRQQRRRDDS